MVSAPLQSPPTLSSSDRTLFSAYLAAHEDLPTLASQTGHDYADLLLWLARPHIQALLASHDDAQFRSDRCLAAETIRATLNACDNDIELRRAATALVRTSVPRPVTSGGRRASEASQGPSDVPRSPNSPTPRPPSPRLDGGRWSEAPRGPEGGVPVSVDAPNTQVSSSEARNPRVASPAPRTQGLQSPGSPPAHTFTEPVLIPFPRLPTHSPAADLRAKSGAAPTLPRGPLAHLTPDPLPRSASP